MLCTFLSSLPVNCAVVRTRCVYQIIVNVYTKIIGQFKSSLIAESILGTRIYNR